MLLMYFVFNIDFNYKTNIGCVFLICKKSEKIARKSQKTPNLDYIWTKIFIRNVVKRNNPSRIKGCVAKQIS